MTVTPRHAHLNSTSYSYDPHLQPTTTRTCTPPSRHSSHILNLLQLLPHLHHAIPNHPRIQSQRPLHRMLRFSAAVEPHDEVVALVVCGALFAGGFGEKEGAPVC